MKGDKEFSGTLLGFDDYVSTLYPLDNYPSWRKVV